MLTDCCVFVATQEEASRLKAELEATSELKNRLWSMESWVQKLEEEKAATKSSPREVSEICHL